MTKPGGIVRPVRGAIPYATDVLQISDIMATRLLYDQVHSGDCPWHNAVKSSCTALFVTMAVCTALDAALTLVLVLLSTALQQSTHIAAIVFHILAHIVSLMAERGIAAVTVSLWVASTSIDGKPITASTYLFFAASLLTTLASSVAAVYSTCAAALHAGKHNQISTVDYVAEVAAVKLEEIFGRRSANEEVLA